MKLAPENLTANRRGLLGYKWVVLTVTTVGIFMATLDSSIIVVGLPQVIAALNTNLAQLDSMNDVLDALKRPSKSR